jgi:hypothetical protein
VMVWAPLAEAVAVLVTVGARPAKVSAACSTSRSSIALTGMFLLLQQFPALWKPSRIRASLRKAVAI